MSKENIAKIAVEASKLLFDNPSWTYNKAIITAKEMIEDAAKDPEMEKIN